jgi:hypothetical protein
LAGMPLCRAAVRDGQSGRPLRGHSCSLLAELLAAILPWL